MESCGSAKAFREYPELANTRYPGSSSVRDILPTPLCAELGGEYTVRESAKRAMEGGNIQSPAQVIEKVELNTSRLLLRAAVQEDAEAMHEAFSDPEVMRYWCVFVP
jgi:hypothetical protein